MLELAEEIKAKFGPTNYSTWDSEIDSFLLARNLKNYIPWRNYGEHGGRPNPEHRQHGLSKTHRADILYDKLAFMPLYATPSTNPGETTQMFLWVRFSARLKGIARLAIGKFLRPAVLKGSSTPGRMVSFALRRHLTLRL